MRFPGLEAGLLSGGGERWVAVRHLGRLDLGVEVSEPVPQESSEHIVTLAKAEGMKSHSQR